MPTYEYRCEKCNHEFEAFQTISEPPVEKCPVCSGKVRRIISGGAGFLFKGSGFYITDYRSAEYKAAAKKDHAGESKAKDTVSNSSVSERSKTSPDSNSNTSSKTAGKTS